MTTRFELRTRYIEGWYELDADKLISSISHDFVFDDPAEPEPVNRKSLPEFMIVVTNELDYLVRPTYGIYQTRCVKIAMEF